MPDTPLINGFKYGWASLELGVQGARFLDFTEINYSVKGEIGKVRGQGIRVIGRTRGEADYEGSFSMLKAQFERLKTGLGGHGFMLQTFPITVNYRETEGEGAPITDSLLGARITSIDNSHKQGTEALVVKCDLHIMRVYLNGDDPFDDNEE
jgi:hypothetical protein